jgi:hypothetical protein
MIERSDGLIKTLNLEDLILSYATIIIIVIITIIVAGCNAS